MRIKRSTQVHARQRGLGHGRLFVALVALASGGACDTATSKQGASSRLSNEAVNGAAEAPGPEAPGCEVKPPFTGNFEPVLHWAWTGSAVLPAHKQVMMQPVVVDVNRDGTPDIVFSTFDGEDYNTKVTAGYNPNTNGVLRAVSGNGGQELWAVTDPAHRVKPAASIAAGDIDGDGAVEICGIPESGRGIICFENDGAFKFRSAPDAYDYNEWGGPSLTDLEGDGAVEILDGNRVYSNTGALKWVGAGGGGMEGARYTGPVSFAVDIDQDGKLEVVNGRSVYRHDGSLKCTNAEIEGGYSAVANFDGDAAGEIVVSGQTKVSLLDDDCTLLWTRPVHITNLDQPLHDPENPGHGGAPNLADFDGDGQLEIGLAGDWNYTVYGTDGNVKWTYAVWDYSSGKTTSTTFDFEDDGRLEVIYADELKLRIFDGVTGAVRWETLHSSGTTHEYPIIADVDANGAADLVVVENNHATPGVGFNGLRVYHDKKEGWANTRRLWNQHAYSVTNVNDDGTIPSHPLTNWRIPALNTFRSNTAGYLGTGPSPYLAADLVASDVSTSCDGYGSLVLSARVRNQGEAPVAAGVKVAFYKGNPASGGSLLGVATVTDALPAGGSFIATVSVSTSFTGTADIFAVVDDDGTGTGVTTECREDNNSASATGSLSCVVTPANQPPVALCRDVTVNANASCQGRATVNDGSYDPDNGPSPLSVTEAPDASFGLGTHPVTVTAHDGEASAQCIGNVTVVDNTRPAIDCPASQVLETCSLSGAPATFAASATDFCGEAPVSCSYASGSTFPVGETGVTCNAKDSSGNTAVCRFQVEVRGDITPPVLGCPTAPVVVNACTSGGTAANFDVWATDNCGEVPVSCSHASGSDFESGETVVSCSAQDAFGNLSTCEFLVSVGGGDPTEAPTAGADKGLELWPPNHKYVNISLADCAEPAVDACGNTLPLETYGHVLRVTSDEVEDANGNGDGRTCEDMSIIVGTSFVQVRAEREGTGNGRVYTIHYAVTNDAGASTESSCRVYVPHDQGGGSTAVDSGVKYCVGEGCPPGTAEGSPICK
ncbi:HYR domain-containing protein [Archangium sp.]|uniref:HYR domain-containing protein n=1 Tax=Archangium sp. TaxID=1872627 RepID=UPI002EDA6C57